MKTNPTIKIEKRINDELAGIRKIASTLPTKQAHALINHCGKLAVYGRKAQAIADSHLCRPTVALYDARTTEDIAAQASRQKAVLEALKQGRHLDLRNAAEFKVSQMTTTIMKIRKQLSRADSEYEMCDEWVRPEGTRPFKSYWLIPKPQMREEDLV